MSLGSWTIRYKLVGTKPASDVTDPLFRLTLEDVGGLSQFFTDLTSNPAQLRVADESDNILPYLLIGYDAAAQRGTLLIRRNDRGTQSSSVGADPPTFYAYVDTGLTGGESNGTPLDDHHSYFFPAYDDPTASSPQLTDHSGNSADGTVNGGVTQSATGDPWVFNGSTGYVTWPGYDNSSAHSEINHVAVTGGLVASQEGTSGNIAPLYWSGGELFAYVAAALSYGSHSGAQTAVLTRGDSGNLQRFATYLDGTSVASRNANLSDQAGNASIGARPSGANPAAMTLYGQAVSSVALDAAAVAYHFDGQDQAAFWTVTRETGGAGTTVSLESSEHGTQSDAASVSLSRQIGVEDSVHGHESSEASVTTGLQVSTEAAEHSQQSQQIAVSLAAQIAVQSAEHGHEAEQLGVTLAGQMAVESSVHGHESAALGVVLSATITVDASEHASQSDAVTVFTGDVVTFEPSQHTTTSPDVQFALAATIAMQSSEHNHTAAACALLFAGAGLGVRQYRVIGVSSRLGRVRGVQSAGYRIR